MTNDTLIIRLHELQSFRSRDSKVMRYLATAKFELFRMGDRKSAAAALDLAEARLDDLASLGN